MRSKTSIISLALTVAAILALASGGSATSFASRPAAAALVGVAANSTTPLSPVGSGFTYQGSLKSGGSPANGQYDFQFTLYDALTGGNVVGGPVTTANVTVTGGLFTVTLDFGQPAFQGEARYLGIAVRQTGGGTYTTLAPRQALTPTPYALSLKPGAVIRGTTGPGVAILGTVNSGNGYGMYGESTASDGTGLRGVANTGPNAAGVYGSSAGGYGMYGESTANNGTGLRGVANNDFDAKGVYGSSDSGFGVYGSSIDGFGVYGSSTNHLGVEGISIDDIGVYGQSAYFHAIYGESANSGDGVHGVSLNNGHGVSGLSENSDGVYGESNSNVFAGVAGISTSGNGVYGRSTTGWAGFFEGNVNVTGTCCAAAEGTYRIDDPLDPANKYLNHAAVESQDMLDMINGNATTDAHGDAAVTLPSYFQATNRDFRYQLTVLGQFAQVIVSSEIQDNNFSIKTDKPNVKVSWQVTGVRNDPYALQHPLTAEQAKPANEKGYYLHPELYGQPNSKSVDPEVRNPPKAPARPVQPKSASPGGK